MERLKLKQIIFETVNGTNKIYEAVCDDEECYCIEHAGTGVKVLINHSEELLDKIIKKIKRTYALTVNFSNGRPTIKFHTKRDKGSGRVIEYGRPLRYYVYAYYHDTDMCKILRHRIIMLDESLLEWNILDFTEDNLFDLGGKRTEGIEILERPNYPTEKYIAITRNDRIEIQEYSEGLYEMLTTRAYCGMGLNRHTGRLNAVIHFAKDTNGYSIHTFSKAVAIYNEYFKQYRLLRNFIRSIPRVAEMLKDKDIEVGHINACSWNNTKNNLMLMKGDANRIMRDYINEFVGEYNAFPIVIQENGKSVVLVRLVNNGKVFYYKCPTDRHYCNLQLTLLGKNNLLETLNMRRIGTTMCDIDTPKQAYARTKQKNKYEYTEAGFWEWCDMRDDLLNAYRDAPQVFKEWTGDNIDRNTKQSVSIDTVVNEIIPLFIASFQ